MSNVTQRFKYPSAFIVEACEAHDRLLAERDELVAALLTYVKSDQAKLDRNPETNWAPRPIIEARLNAARAALAKVTK